MAPPVCAGWGEAQSSLSPKKWTGREGRAASPHPPEQLR